jgi:uncharacterized protein (TIGR02444 family)
MTGRDAAAESFWRFSLMVYGRPGVAEALIRLQDRGAHNVNLVLFALWLGLCEATRLDVALLGRAKAAIERLDDEIVVPLRRLRRALRDDRDPDMCDLRRRMLVLEIAAERRVQARLAASVARRKGGGDRRATAEANLRRILGVDFASGEAALLRETIGGITGSSFPRKR